MQCDGSSSLYAFPLLHAPFWEFLDILLSLSVNKQPNKRECIAMSKEMMVSVLVMPLGVVRKAMPESVAFSP